MNYQRNADGAVINPPIIKRFEDDMHSAQARCDFGAIIRITAEYNRERDAIVKSEEGGERGLGWTDDDMRGGVGEDATALSIRPRFPDGPPQLPAGMDDALLVQNEQLRAEMREVRMLLAQLAAQGQVPDATTDKPTPVVEAAAKPLGGTGVTSGPMDKPTASVSASQPLGGTGVTAGPADPPNPAPPIYMPPPATDDPDATGEDS